MLPNTRGVVAAIEEIKIEIQKYLYEKYKTKLGLVISYIEVDEQGIMKYSESLVRLQEKTLTNKNRKFIDIINIEKDNFFINSNTVNDLCKYCYENESKIHFHRNEEINACSECYTHIQLGEYLVKNIGIGKYYGIGGGNINLNIIN